MTLSIPEPATAEAGFDAAAALSGALRRAGRLAEAVEPYLRAEAGMPSLTDGLNSFALMLQQVKLHREALRLWQRLVERRPDNYHAWMMIAWQCAAENQMAAAMHACNRAAALRPTLIAPRLARCMARLRPVYASMAEIDAARDAYAAELRELASQVSADPAAIPDPLAIGNHQPFSLPYQGRNDRALQAEFGRLACHVLQAAYPQYAVRPAMPRLDPGERLRIGFASGHFINHSNWKMRLRGWMRDFDRDRFQLHAYHTRAKRDDATTEAEAGFDRFFASGYVAALAARIMSDRLHVLIFPEIGMGQTTLCLAGLHLAPLQFTSWCHPQSSGLPTIDAMLSSALMEPDDGDAHYTERLIRVPGLGVSYPRRAVVAKAPDWPALGLRPDAVLYLCCQNPSKYLPHQDPVFARIALAVPDSQFLFIDAHRSSVMDGLIQRLGQCFIDHGLDPARHLVRLPRLGTGAYAALNRRCDVFLDTFDWNGANTTLEALAQGLPVVTLPGRLMRGRHAFGILCAAGMAEHVARDVDDYIRLAVLWGTNPAERARISALALAGMEVIYQDKSSTIALMDLIEREVRASIAGRWHPTMSSGLP